MAAENNNTNQSPAPKMGEHSAFFYGTLMVREILHRVIYGTTTPETHPMFSQYALSLTFSPAVLENHCRHRVQECDYPGVIPQEGKSVLGVYVSGLTEGDIFRLGRFEGSEYTLMDVTVKLVRREGEGAAMTANGDGDMVATKTYIYTAGDGFLDKREWDFEEFRREKLKNWVGEDHEYAEVDEAVETSLDIADDSDDEESGEVIAR